MALPFVSLLEKEFIYRAAVLLPYARRSTAEERNARNGIRLKQMLDVYKRQGKERPVAFSSENPRRDGFVPVGDFFIA